MILASKTQWHIEKLLTPEKFPTFSYYISEEKVHSCPECGSEALDAELVDLHYSTCHRYYCHPCGLSFYNSHLLTAHESTHSVGFHKKKMTKLVVHHWDEPKDGKLTLNSMVNLLKKEGCSCVDYTFNPGTTFSEHTHNQDKMDCIVSGRLWFKMMGEEIILGPGDRLEIPRNTPHAARVEGSEQVVFVDATRH